MKNIIVAIACLLPIFWAKPAQANIFSSVTGVSTYYVIGDKDQGIGLGLDFDLMKPIDLGPTEITPLLSVFGVNSNGDDMLAIGGGLRLLKSAVSVTLGVAYTQRVIDQSHVAPYISLGLPIK